MQMNANQQVQPKFRVSDSFTDTRDGTAGFRDGTMWMDIEIGLELMQQESVAEFVVFS